MLEFSRDFGFRLRVCRPYRGGGDRGVATMESQDLPGCAAQSAGNRTV